MYLNNSMNDHMNEPEASNYLKEDSIPPEDANNL